MEAVVPGLYASPPEPLSFAPRTTIRAFLLQSLRFETDPPEWRLGLAELGAAMDAIEDFTTPPGARFDGPVLVMAGERSDYVRPEHHALFRSLFPRAAFTTVPAAGHWVHAENPAGFLAASFIPADA